MKYTLFFTFTLIVSMMMTSCEKDDPIITNDEEVITTLNYRLTPMGGGTTTTFSFVDLDGDGGNDPIITGGTLESNQTYTATLELLNESESPSEDITEEIEEEDEDHQFFFSSDIAPALLSIAYDDQDADENPVGLSTTVNTGIANTAFGGSLTIILRHKPNKSASGVSTGDITNAGGETDIEVTFPINVQ